LAFSPSFTYRTVMYSGEECLWGILADSGSRP
jgi:hypothetical protein